ncbi:MAG TPA: ABC transporter ATP-binding protein [Paenirhodobacter sp.]
MTPPLAEGFRTRNLNHDVPGRRLLHDLSVEITPGVVTALIGRNGSGKSTLLRHLTGQVRPSSGEVRFQGRALHDWSARDLARHLAYLPQTPPPAEGMHLAELVGLGRYPWRGTLGRLRPEDHAIVDDALRQCGIAHLRDRLVETLSGGERQRGWIAMMLAQGAQWLLLDEPISALDVAHQVEVLALVQRMSRENGLSVIVVLHDVNMAARYCDRVVALGDGQVLLEGPITALMTPEALMQIYGLPMLVLGEGTRAFAQPV